MHNKPCCFQFLKSYSSMRRFIIFWILLSNVHSLYSQEVKYPKDSTYSFSFFEGQISDTNMLNLKVKYKNFDNEIILTHKSLIEDIEYGDFGNFDLEMEKLKDGKYMQFVDQYIDYIYEGNRQKNRSHYNELRPGDSSVLNFNLISRIGVFYKGKYRIRINLLKVPNSFPVRYVMEYATSRWFYFEIMKDLLYKVIY